MSEEEQFTPPEELITIRSYDKAVEAHLAKNVLENEGIPAYLADEGILNAFPLFANAVGGVKLKIREEDAEAAQKILYESEHAVLTDEDEAPIACPKCNSTNILYHLSSQKNAGGILAAIVSFFLFFGTYPLYNKDVCKCRDCGNEFDA